MKLVKLKKLNPIRKLYWFLLCTYLHFCNIFQWLIHLVGIVDERVQFLWWHLLDLILFIQNHLHMVICRLGMKKSRSDDKYDQSKYNVNNFNHDLKVRWIFSYSRSFILEVLCIWVTYVRHYLNCTCMNLQCKYIVSYSVTYWKIRLIKSCKYLCT